MISEDRACSLVNSDQSGLSSKNRMFGDESRWWRKQVLDR